MRNFDIENWSRREHYNIFSALDHPHFGLCANVELKNFYPAIKQCDVSFNVAIVYVLSRTANNIPEFRYRIRDGKIVEHEIVHPSTTIMGEDDVFGFCTIEYSEVFSEFAHRATERIAVVQQAPSLKDEPGRDDLLFMTAIPWVSFTSFMHPVHLKRANP